MPSLMMVMGTMEMEARLTRNESRDTFRDLDEPGNEELLPDPDQLSCRGWVRQHLRTEKGERLSFGSRSFGYMKDLYDCYERKGETLIIQKAAQVGASAFAIARTLWLMSQFDVTVIYTLPTGSDCSDFSQTRFNPVVRNSTGIGRATVDNVGLKQVGGSFLFLRGTWNERQAISIPADCLVHDEVDFSRQDILGKYPARLAASPLAWTLMLSTPTIPDYGINRAFRGTDMREWFVPCAACGKFHEPLTEDHIIDGEFRCPRCKTILNRAAGRWEPTATSNTPGWHISQAVAPWSSAKTIMEQRDDYSLLRDYYNFVWGLPYAGGAEVVTREDLIALITDDVPTEGRTAVGVDWGDDTWVAVRRGNAMIHFEQIRGDTRKHPVRVMELMGKFNAGCVADFGYGDAKNVQIAEKFPSRFWTCQYDDSAKALVERVDIENGIRMQRMTVDRTRSLEEVFGEVKKGASEGGIRVLRTAALETVIKHFASLAKESKIDRHGDARIVYERKGPDHFVHAWNYARLGVGARGRVPHLRVL